MHSSLAIEGNTLNIEKVTAVLDGEKVLGSKKEILEVQNAIKAHNQISRFKPHSSNLLFEALRFLMRELIADAGRWRNSNVGIFHGTKSLGLSDKVGHASPFIEFSLSTIHQALDELFDNLKPKALTTDSRLELARAALGQKGFSRRDYLKVFKTISTATASRDLSLGVTDGLLFKNGDKRTSSYRFKK